MVASKVLEAVIKDITRNLGSYFPNFYTNEMLGVHYNPSPSESVMVQTLNEYAPTDIKSSTEWMSFLFNRSKIDTSDLPTHRSIDVFLHDKDERIALDLFRDDIYKVKLCQFTMSLEIYTPDLDKMEALEEYILMQRLPTESQYELPGVPGEFSVSYGFDQEDYSLTQMSAYSDYGTISTISLSSVIRYAGVFLLGEYPLIRYPLLRVKFRS